MIFILKHSTGYFAQSRFALNVTELSSCPFYLLLELFTYFATGKENTSKTFYIQSKVYIIYTTTNVNEITGNVILTAVICKSSASGSTHFFWVRATRTSLCQTQVQ